MNRPRPIDLLVIAGFLGAGKTSLLGHLLATAGRRRLAVVVNEWSRYDIDGSRLAAQNTDLAIDRISGGSIFCHCRAATLHRTLRRLLSSPAPPDSILVEASGLADPTTLPDLLAAVGTTDQLRPGVITLVHPLTLGKVLPNLPAAAGQLRAADLIVCNHCDRCSSEELQNGDELIRSLAPTTPLTYCSHGRLPWSALSFTTTDPARADQPAETSTTATPSPPVIDARLHPPAAADIDAWLRHISRSFGTALLRAKGQLSGPDGLEAVDWDGECWSRHPLPSPSAATTGLVILIPAAQRDHLFRLQQELAV